MMMVNEVGQDDNDDNDVDGEYDDEVGHDDDEDGEENGDDDDNLSTGLPLTNLLSSSGCCPCQG